MAIGSGGRNSRSVLSEINVTPFVDVMLVLLVIFMITAPILYQGVNVNLPQTSSEPIPSVQREKKVVVTLTSEGEIFIEEDKYELSELKLQIREIVRKSGKDIRVEQVFLRADTSVPYGKVINVMNEIKKAGVEKLGLITEPVEKG